MKTFKTGLAVWLALGGAGHAALEAEAGIAQLQQAWLQCDRLASTTLVDPGTAAQCSQVHEQLLQRGFEGDFRKMLAWWQVNRVATPPAPTAALPARRP